MPQAQRATYFSVLSLAGRLAFSATPFALSRAAGADSAASWSTLASMLRLAALFGIVGFAFLTATVRQTDSLFSSKAPL